MKRSHAPNGYASFYNIEIINYFNPGLQLKNTESSIKNKLKDLLPELRGFEFVIALAI